MQELLKKWAGGTLPPVEVEHKIEKNSLLNLGLVIAGVVLFGVIIAHILKKQRAK